MHFQKILVTTDFSDESYRAFELASYAAKMEGSEITLLSVIEDWDVPPALVPSMPHAESIAAYREEMVQHATEKLKKIAEEQFHQAKVNYKVIAGNRGPARHILDYAKQCGAELIVLSSHGRGALGRLFLGSVVQQVLKEATCPVLVAPQER